MAYLLVLGALWIVAIAFLSGWYMRLDAETRRYEEAENNTPAKEG